MLLFYRRTEVESEEIVAELVHGFLLPEVQKQAMQDRGKCLLLSFQTTVINVQIYALITIDTYKVCDINVE